MAADLKLCNIMTGITSHSSMHPCTWCNANKHRLHLSGAPRTIGSLHDCFWQYFECGSQRATAKRFDNVVHPSLLIGPQADLVLDHLPPPELHLLTGPVATIYSSLVSIWPEACMWLKACNVETESYHGQSFTGNSARRLLKNVDKLQSMCPIECLKYVKVFRAFERVVTSCFGTSLDSNYRENIQRFRDAYMDLSVRVTPKIHAVFHHIAEFCERKGCGLGPYSEQASESVHHDFNKIWLHFKRPYSHSDFADHLLKALQVYNSRHI